MLLSVCAQAALLRPCASPRSPAPFRSVVTAPKAAPCSSRQQRRASGAAPRAAADGSEATPAGLAAIQELDQLIGAGSSKSNMPGMACGVWLGNAPDCSAQRRLVAGHQQQPWPSVAACAVQACWPAAAMALISCCA